jgi:hypothetical protein
MPEQGAKNVVASLMVVLGRVGFVQDPSLLLFGQALSVQRSSEQPVTTTALQEQVAAMVKPLLRLKLVGV